LCKYIKVKTEIAESWGVEEVLFIRLMTVKKIILVLLLAVVTSGGAWAQKGMKGVGVNFAGNVGFDKGSIGLGGAVKFQYNISDYFRLEPSISFFALVDDDYSSAFDKAALLNVHAFFMSPRSLRPYAFAGVGYLDYLEKDYYYGSSYKGDVNTDGFGFDAGLGVDYRVSHKISLQFEAGALMGVADDDCIGIKFNLGLCYNF